MQIDRNNPQHLTSVQHQGLIFLFGIDSNRDIYYAVRRTPAAPTQSAQFLIPYRWCRRWGICGFRVFYELLSGVPNERHSTFAGAGWDRRWCRANCGSYDFLDDPLAWSGDEWQPEGASYL